MRFILILLIAAIFSSPIQSYAASGEISAAAKRVLQKLKTESGDDFSFTWNEMTDTPSELTGYLSKPSRHSPQWIVYEFLYKTKTLYGLKNPKTDMKITKIIQSSDGTIQANLQQYLYNTPVWNDELVIQIDNLGVIRRVTGSVYPDLEKKTYNHRKHAIFPVKKAISLALSVANVDRAEVDEPVVDMYYYPLRAGTPLIYAVNLKKRDSNHEYDQILIHSLTGRIIEQS
jgi:Zn-dependent metalloprotease